MTLLSTAKSAAEHIPQPLGQLLSRVPFAWRLGPEYARARKRLDTFLHQSLDRRRATILENIRSIVASALRDVPFYRNLYQDGGTGLESLAGFEDIRTLPLVTRSDLQGTPLEERSHAQPGRMPINTGGTSGEPLNFYLDRFAFAREWAHMHFIWSHLDYRPADVKLTLRGKNLGRDLLRYNAVHNELVLNTYAPLDDQAEAVLRVADKLQFVHGYPSAIYAFVRGCAERHPATLDALRGRIRGILFGSEFPAPVYRDLVEHELGAPSLSWYGHSEMAILAYETEPYLYTPLHTYGYCEAIPGETGAHRLVGTSYHNTASPFIRYDTGDLVDPDFEDGLLRSFRVTEGRVGEFLEDSGGNSISLTSLVFGRHHRLFDIASFVQVAQDRPGEARLLVTRKPGSPLTASEALAAFDDSDVAITFSADVRDEPLRSSTGKVPLKVTG